MTQIFQPRADTILRSAMLAAVILPVALILAGYGVMNTPFVTRQFTVQTQPVPFSHQHHVGGLGIDCRFCHWGVENSAYATIPPTEVCMTCHSQVWTQAAMLAPVRESLATNRPIAWQRVHALPDYVYFAHNIHVAKGIGCSTCHGAVDHMPLMYQAQQMTMGWCLNCHRNPEQFLRPQSLIYATNWKAPADQDQQGTKLLHEYLIAKEHLSDCSVCHR